MTVLGHAESPLGTLLLSGDGEALTGLWFLGQKYEGAGLPENAPTDEGLPVFETARAWLRAYFAGEALPELPPQDVVREVTPLGGTVKLITWGLTLCSVTLNIGSLLPLLMRVSGTLLCLIGFRRLRRENGWFRACYGLAILRLALDWAGELRQTTLLRPPAALETAVLTVSVLALLALSFCLWRGLLTARRKAGQPPKATAAGALCLWYAVLFGVLFLAGGTVTGRVAVLAEGEAAERSDIKFLEKLPVFHADGTVKD